MISRLVYAIGGFVVALIALRFVLRLLGANPDSGLVNWIYTWSTPFVSPFAGIFGQEATITGTGVVTAGVFDWTALIALVIIGILVGIVGSVFGGRR